MPATTRSLDRIVTLVPALNAMEPALRDRVLAATRSRWTRITIDPTPAIRKPATGRYFDRASERVSERLDLPAGQQVRFALYKDGKRANDRPWQRGRGDTIRRNYHIDISVPLADGSWLNWRRVVHKSSQWHGPALRFYILLGVCFLIVMVVGLLFIRRITKPIKALQTAVERAGRGQRDALVAETGPAEIQDVSRAFNEMQGRIARFDARASPRRRRHRSRPAHTDNQSAHPGRIAGG